MKNTVILILLLSVLSCKAQTPILDGYDDNISYGNVNNAYYKDVTNKLNPFVGTWLYTSGNDTLKIVLQKKELIFMDGGGINYYTDYIIGSYQYIEDGIEKLNCLNDMTINHSNVYDYNLYGDLLMRKTNYPQCLECLPDEKRLVLKFIEPLTRNISDLKGTMIVRKVVEGGVVKLKINFFGPPYFIGDDNDGNPTTITHHTIPYGNYELIKQP